MNRLFTQSSSENWDIAEKLFSALLLLSSLILFPLLYFLTFGLFIFEYEIGRYTIEEVFYTYYLPLLFKVLIPTFALGISSLFLVFNKTWAYHGVVSTLFYLAYILTYTLRFRNFLSVIYILFPLLLLIFYLNPYLRKKHKFKLKETLTYIVIPLVYFIIVFLLF